MLNDTVALRRGVCVSCRRTVLAKRVATRPKGGRDELSVRVESSLCEVVSNYSLRFRERLYDSFIRFRNVNLPREGE